MYSCCMKTSAQNCTQVAHASHYCKSLRTSQCPMFDLLTEHVLHTLQGSHGPWHLQSIEVLEKPSGKLYYFPCPQWLDRGSNTRVKLFLGRKPPKFTPTPRPAPEKEEEDWHALVPAAEEEPLADMSASGTGGSYTVMHLTLVEIGDCSQLLIWCSVSRDCGPLGGHWKDPRICMWIVQRDTHCCDINSFGCSRGLPCLALCIAHNKSTAATLTIDC